MLLNHRLFFYFLLILLSLVYISCGKSALDPGNNDAIKNKFTASVNLYSSNNWEEREKAVIDLYYYKNSFYSRNILLFFLKASEDRHSAVRIKAINGLHLMPDPAALERLRIMAREDPKANVRWHAIQALADYRIKENEELFVESFKSSDWLIREAAIVGLLKINNPESQIRNILLIKDGLNDPVISVKLATLQNLELKNELFYPDITKIINDTQSSHSILKAALSAIKGYRLDYNTRDRLITLLTHYESEIRIEAFRALKEEPPE